MQLTGLKELNELAVNRQRCVIYSGPAFMASIKEKREINCMRGADNESILLNKKLWLPQWRAFKKDMERSRKAYEKEMRALQITHNKEANRGMKKMYCCNCGAQHAFSNESFNNSDWKKCSKPKCPMMACSTDSCLQWLQLHNNICHGR